MIQEFLNMFFFFSCITRSWSITINGLQKSYQGPVRFRGFFFGRKIQILKEIRQIPENTEKTKLTENKIRTIFLFTRPQMKISSSCVQPRVLF